MSCVILPKSFKLTYTYFQDALVIEKMRIFQTIKRHDLFRRPQANIASIIEPRQFIDGKMIGRKPN